jgi:hypothetical protein
MAEATCFKVLLAIGGRVAHEASYSSYNSSDGKHDKINPVKGSGNDQQSLSDFGSYR